ncbi:MAG: PSD1 and planctomycete cytochrome C domain-containing protein, partial [Verrucomicrobiales bacterium]|nr:PSD1 and planctomycete cytochrome C domain-containing protein [Verrucomicrobiales bacterium]
MKLKSILYLIFAVLANAEFSWAEINFNRDIKPILSENCYFCHGPDQNKRKAKLRLDNFKDATASHDGVSAIVPNDPDKSELIYRIFSDDPDEVMPPPEAKLNITKAQKDTLKKWISSGAKYEKHWAFIKPEKPKPLTKKHPVDEFVSNTLKDSQMGSSPQADPETLIRRVSLDLTGLPPRPEEINNFVTDDSPEAYEKLVDRLLNSQAYGEKMTWDWLDAARYADSNGYQGDSERTMWPWRDWVIKAFNKNLSFDKFTVWQIAGDLLPEPTFEQKLATGFLRNHPINGEGGRINEENRVDYVMDMTETTGTVWLGLTFNCCRCHDHKFDPITQKEYYQMSAYFNQTPIDGGGRSGQQAPNLIVPTQEQIDEIDKTTKEIESIGQKIKVREIEVIKEGPKLPDDQAWKVLIPSETNAKVQRLTVQKDQSILASGDNPKNDTYTIRAKTDIAEIGSFKIEALMDPSMTGGGLARSDSGNFVLTGFEVSITRKGSKEPESLGFASSEATFEQGSHKISASYDGNPATGWAVHEGRTVDREHEGIFRLKDKIVAGKGTVIQFILRHDSPHISHNLGRFRLSVSEKTDAPINREKKIIDAQLAELTKKSKELNERLNKLKGSGPKVMIMEDRDKPRQTYILDKGSYEKRGQEVSMGTPAALPEIPDNFPKNRLGLAKWIVSAENPLTSRVIVNRFWQQIFGVGLVKTSEDFGTQGETPMNQELLDYLAATFIESGWDVKKLMRFIVTSDTYKQTSKATKVSENETNYSLDPENRFLSRGPRFRMPSWMLRDNALAASGLLVPKIGGSP